MMISIHKRNRPVPTIEFCTGIANWIPFTRSKRSSCNSQKNLDVPTRYSTTCTAVQNQIKLFDVELAYPHHQDIKKDNRASSSDPPAQAPSSSSPAGRRLPDRDRTASGLWELAWGPKLRGSARFFQHVHDFTDLLVRKQ